MLARSSITIYYEVYGCTEAQVESSVEVSGKIFGMKLSLHRDVHI